MKLHEEVLAHLNENNVREVKSLVNEADTLQILQLIEELPQEHWAVVFRLLNKDKALEVFERLDKNVQQKLISLFREERAAEIFSNMEPDDRARLLDELPARVAKQLLASLSQEDREKTSILMGYAPETAGRIMTPEYVRLRRNQTVKDALESIRQHGKDKEMVYTLYVTDDTRTLEGVVSLRELIVASPDQKVGDIMTEKVVSVSTETDQEEVARILQDLDLLAVPVVDSESRLVGIITIDDAVDILEEETTDDIFDKVGLASFASLESGRSQRLVSGSILDVWKMRIPFLLITLVGGLLAGAVIETYEETLEAIAAVAIFIPVIMDMGGNIGTQSSTIFTRAFVLGHINMKKFARQWLREVGIGLSIGALMGVVAGFIAAYWQQEPNFGLAVGISLALTITLATALGYLVPYILVRIGTDQAAGSDPFITTIKDISGLFIYFFFVNAFLGHLL